ncbi:cytochrome P450 4B1-like [Pelobates cultripes]|uniref:Cytochrome P450 4B1-like n=1 Tax=Pelobates cultripes TaxID=61616 RepID=A0AAD1WJC4_PELCU|nr:cytochrome P450 4B1-like [Pelobates cultripes]
MASFVLLDLLSLKNVYQLCQWAAWLCALFVLFTATKLYLRRRELIAVFRHFPGPSRHWLYGNAHEFRQDGKDLDNVVEHSEKFSNAYPMWLGNFFASLIVYDPDYAKAILSRQDPKDNFAYYFITPWIGKGLLVLSGQKWFQHRRLLTPGFHYDVLKPYVKLMGDCTKVMLGKWERLVPENKPIELFHFVSLMTLDTIMKCAFSYQSDCQNNSENAYIKAVYELSYLVDHRFRCFPYHNDLIYYLSPHGLRFRRALKVAHQHTGHRRLLLQPASIPWYITLAPPAALLLECSTAHCVPFGFKLSKEMILNVVPSREKCVSPVGGDVNWERVEKNCIGQNSAMNEMKVALALTLKRFEISPDPDNEPLKLAQLVLRSVNGIYLRFKKVETEEKI